MTILARLYQRQGITFKTDEDWARYEAHKAERKATNVANARDVLFRNCIAWDELPNRVGKDQLVAFNVFFPSLYNGETDRIIAFYPEIGKWFDLDENVRFGVRNLARYITGDETC